MITEAEARKKWCPYMHQRVVVNMDGTAEGAAAIHATTNRCIASDCMAWETEYETADYRTDEGYIEFKKTPTDFGDCGLKRGKP